jgi:serine/threonine protein kinase
MRLRDALSDRYLLERELGAEIRTTANLQHPHILPLHDSGEAGGFLFYVMPFIDGETLRARLTRTRLLPLPEAMLIAREVADALAYAHGARRDPPRHQAGDWSPTSASRSPCRARAARA